METNLLSNTLIGFITGGYIALVLFSPLIAGEIVIRIIKRLRK